MKQLLRKVGIVAGTVAMASLTAPLIVPLPPLEGTVSPESLADAESKFIRLGSVNVRYKRRGEGSPFFVLLHGYLRTSRSWHGVMASFEEIGSAVAYDRPAFGFSSRPMPGEWRGPSPYGYHAQAAMATQLMDALDVDKATLVGHGMGARIAALTALLYPQRVERLVLVAPEPSDGGRPAWQRLFMASPQMRRLGPVLLRSRVARQVEEMLGNSWQRPERMPPEMRMEFQSILSVHDWDRGLWELARANETLDKTISLKTINVPTLVVAGKKDVIADTERIVRIAAGIPRAHLAVIPEAGNAPHEERPDAFMDAMKEFVAAPA
jgi:pimeloyl-ACP methyl ester carboxylesterase